MSELYSWKFSTTSQMAWESMLESCKNAKESIDLEQYIFGGGTVERAFADLFLAKAKAEIKYTTLTKVESGVVNKPSVQTMVKIAKALGVSIEDLIK